MTPEKNHHESFDERLHSAMAENGMVNDTGTDMDNDNIAIRYGRIMQLGIELFSAVGVGAGMGYFLDKWLDIAPIGLIVFFFMGVAAGFINLYRFVKNLGYDIGYKSDNNNMNE